MGLKRYAFGTLGATALAAVVTPFLTATSPVAAIPVNPPSPSASASAEPSAPTTPKPALQKVSRKNPVSITRTTVDPSGRPSFVTEIATTPAQAAALVKNGGEVTQPVRALDAPTGSDPMRDQQWALPKMRAAEAWTTSTGAGVTVAVLDTGVAASHPDLAAHVLPGYNALTGQAGNSNDVHGHGTHVAGSIAAVTGNGVGVAGVAPDVKILPVKVLGDNGAGDSASTAKGIVWAADNGAQVINMSLGGGYSSSYETAVAYARSKGVVVVAAAGNERSKGSPVSYPGATPGVIAVAATDVNDAVTSFSNAGSYVDVAAPGAGILSTLPGSKYGSMSGTSMASPHVAALAALLRAKNAGLTPDQVEQAMEASAKDLGAAGKDNDYGYGRVDAVAALAAIGGGAPAPTPTPTPTVPSLPTPSISTDAQSASVAYNTALKTTFKVTKPDGTPWSKLSVQLCTADAGADVFKCKKVTTPSAGTVTHNRKATTAQRFKLTIAAGKANTAAESETYEITVRSAVTLTQSKKNLTMNLTGAAKQVLEVQRSLDGQTWETDRTIKATSRTTLTKVTPGYAYRVVVPDVPAVLGSMSNTVQM